MAEEKLDIVKRKSAFYEWLKPRVSSALYSDFCVIGEQLNALCVQKRLCINSIFELLYPSNVLRLKRNLEGELLLCIFLSRKV